LEISIVFTTVGNVGEKEKYNIHAKKVPIDRSQRARFAACVKARDGTGF
jgi:hypothetical protein